ncbi:hypothetical protein PX554_13940 [Sphingomonas sp. H39-1-10]|nr:MULTISPECIES: hypothetical protein [Sphingomonadaceae]MDF0489238.1 hypothetical protein [Sphingomonas pollutisoli]
MTVDELTALLIEAGEILDEIESLPLDDYGYRELPPNSLDRAREITKIAFELRSAQTPNA